MSQLAFTTIERAPTAGEADILMAALRAAGLHPLELAMSDHFSVAGVDISYPITVPSEEAEAAREVLDLDQK